MLNKIGSRVAFHSRLVWGTLSRTLQFLSILPKSYFLYEVKQTQNIDMKGLYYGCNTLLSTVTT